MKPLSRRATLAGIATLATPAIAQDRPFRIGLMLPFSGIHAAQGEAIGSGFDLYVRQIGRQMGGRAIELVRLNDESDPRKASSNINRLLGRERAEALIGSVHSGVTTTLMQAARDQHVPLIIPGAGDAAMTRGQCAAPVFRSSGSDWQPGYGMGRALAVQGIRKAAWISWDDTLGRDAGEGFRDGLRAGGADLVLDLKLPIPGASFQATLGRLRGSGAEAVAAGFSGGAAVQFIKDYAAAGLRDKMPLCGPGLLTEGPLTGMGAEADGIRTALHYGDGIESPKNTDFRASYQALTGKAANVFAVQGYDAAAMLAAGLAACRADISELDNFSAAVRAATIDSPRGAFTISASHNPIQTMWLREVRNGENRVIGTAAENLADPGTGCAMT